MFTPKDIENFNKIYNLVKTNGYTLEGAKKALKEKTTINTAPSVTSMNSSNENEEIILSLEKIKEKLKMLKEKD